MYTPFPKYCSYILLSTICKTDCSEKAIRTFQLLLFKYIYVDNNDCKCFNVRFYITGASCVQDIHILAMMGVTTVNVCVNGTQQLCLRFSTANKYILLDERWATELQSDDKVISNIGTWPCPVVSPTVWNMLPSSVRSVENID